MALKDKLEDLSKAIDEKRRVTAELYGDFEKAKEALEKADIDLSRPEDERTKAAMQKADDAMKPYSKSADELRVMEGQFERLALMAADGGEKTIDIRRENQLDRDGDQLKGLRESLGQKAIDSDAYKELKDSGAFADGSQVPFKGQLGGPMDMAQFKSLITGGSGPAGGVLNVPERYPGIVGLPQLPLGILDLVTVGETSERAVEFVRILARTIRAAEVAEAISAAPIDGSTVTAVRGGLKPESDLTFDVIQEAVKTIAHWIPGTRNQLADAPFLRTLVDAEMLDGVRRRAEAQVLRGDGTGDNIRGLYRTPGVAAYTIGRAAAGEPAADAVHRVFTLVRLSGFNPSALAIDPRDWEGIRLTKDANGNYIWGPPSMAGTNQIWGVTAVETIAAEQGLPIAGEWARALFLVREAAKILVSDSHADFFVRNLIAILAEMRGVLAVPRPQAFGTVDLTP